MVKKLISYSELYATASYYKPLFITKRCISVNILRKILVYYLHTDLNMYENALYFVIGYIQVSTKSTFTFIK